MLNRIEYLSKMHVRTIRTDKNVDFYQMLVIIYLLYRLH